MNIRLVKRFSESLRIVYPVALEFVITYALVLFLYTVVFILLFQQRTFGGSILFYRGVVFSCIAAVAVLFLRAVPIKKFWNKICPHAGTWVSAVIASASLHFCLFVVVPVTVDRSVTTFLLIKMRSLAPYAPVLTTQPLLTKEQLQFVFVNEYVSYGDAIGRRMKEQISSGNVEEKFTKDGERGYAITQQGISFVKFASFISDVYSTSKL